MGLFNRHGDRELIPIWWALALVLGVALAVIGGLLWLAWALLGPPSFVREQVGLPAYLDIVKIVLAVVAGLGGVVALVVAYRRQRTGEQAERREHARLENERTRLLNERFDIASEKLGSDKPAVRLAGVHAIANLADDWDDHEARQMCIDVLCSYLRMTETAIPAESTDEDEDHDAPHSLVTLDSDRETRHTILRTIAAHLRKGSTAVSWSGYDFDIRAITVDIDLDFTAADFTGGILNLSRAQFIDGEVSFEGAKFTGGDVSFADAHFNGGSVWFGQAKFIDGEVTFDDAQVGAGRLFFADAQFTGGYVFFSGAQFIGGQLFFGNAQFNGSDVRFDHTQFIAGHVTFLNAQFADGHVSFSEAQFNGSEVDFAFAQFTGGNVDLSTSIWHEPPKWLPESASGLLLPADRR